MARFPFLPENYECQMNGLSSGRVGRRMSPDLARESVAERGGESVCLAPLPNRPGHYPDERRRRAVVHFPLVPEA